jgi:hypothetical protein
MGYMGGIWYMDTTLNSFMYFQNNLLLNELINLICLMTSIVELIHVLVPVHRGYGVHGLHPEQPHSL